MPIEFKCNQCGKKLRAPDTTAGKRVKCPGCGNPVSVPQPVFDAEVASPPAPAEEEIYQTTDEDEVAAPDADRRPCPMCGEMIKQDAAKCRFCGEVFDEDLRRVEKKKRKKKRGSADDETMSTGDWVVALLCSGIGCIVGIVWMIQGKPKGYKMLGVSFLGVIFWNVVNAILQGALKKP
jgi:DNA-directed RNA polymerase subunit M/transcription elongation factor TFIIS